MPSGQRDMAMIRCRGWFLVRLLALTSGAAAQMQFEIPAEMLSGMMGGMMGGGGPGRQVKATEWPKTENSETAPEFEWLVNTEWMGKTAKYLLLKGGIIESPLKECEPEGQCLWAANNGRVLVNTPTLKVIKFTIQGFDQADKKKLENKVESELKKIHLMSEKAAKSGKKSQLDFSRVAVADDKADSFITKDLYKILDVPEDEAQGSIKSKFRRLSIINHPDKGGDPEVFNELREAYEVLGDADKRGYYDMGGMQLVKNVENSMKEVEGQKAQLDMQLSKVPKNHPQYQQFKAQIEDQKRQFEQKNIKFEIEKKLRSDDIEVSVPISAQELYSGVAKKHFEFKRLVICRGCRDDPEAPQCQDCGRCQPEKVQVPKYANTPFGRQVVAMNEKEIESREKCREVPMNVTDLRIFKGATEGTKLKTVADIGHQVPGKIPGRVVFKVQRGSANDTYTIAESDLHTVVRISLEEALFGFSISWQHLGDETVTLVRKKVTQPDEVVRLKKKGLGREGGARGDLFVRLAVDLPQVDTKQGTVTLKAPTAQAPGPAKREREDPVELREGAAWRRWGAWEAATSAEGKKPGTGDKKKQEL